MVVELHDVDLPEDLVLGSVLNCDGEVTSVVEASEFAVNNGTGLDSTSYGGNWHWLGDGFVKRKWLTTDTSSFLEGL